MIKTTSEEGLGDGFGQVVEQLGELPLIEDVMRDITSTLLEGQGGKDGTNADLPSGVSNSTSGYNRIPSPTHGACHDVLLVYCLGWTNFTPRLRDIASHVAHHCPDTRQVYFVTDSWLPKQWKEHEDLFRVMPANLTVLFYFMGRLVPLTP
jgi:hypothetical protein